MTNLIKKIYVAITLLSVTAIGHAYGAQTCRESVNCCNPCETTCCGQGFVSAEFLYWRAFEDGLDICIPQEESNFVTTDGFVTSRFVGKGRDINFKWDPAFRLGAGYAFGDNCGCDGWDVGVFWTHFHSHAHASYACASHLNWKLDFDVVDLVAGYDHKLNCCFGIRPFLGLRLARIDQKLHISEGDSSGSFSSFPSSSFPFSDDELFVSSTVKNTQDFKGVGPILGLEADWNIGCGFSFYASADVAWLYGKYKIKFTDSTEFIDAFDFCEISKHVDANVAVGDAAIGIRWEKCFCNDLRLLVQLGFEHHRYFDYNRLGDCGDLSFDGINLGVGLRF